MVQTPNSPSADSNMDALKQYGSYIITVILLVLAGYFGWTYWQNNHARVDTVAADHYADIQNLNQEINLASQNPDLNAEATAALDKSRGELTQNIDALVSSHGDSVYAWQALMIKAREQADADDFEGASETLKTAAAIDLGDAGLSAITRLRYAETLLAAGDADAALSEAKSDMPSPFEASQQELLGDIYMAQKNEDAAKKSYNNAWELLRKRQESRAVLALKMESLGMTVAPIESAPALIQQAPAASAPAAPQDIAVDSAPSA
ncbi:YfgM family protein [Psychrobacter aestuarii]|uniref:Ancillary SecYEG translocon subunit n=1 Tax=Psychrobacter aestuarii TaxID=556327 RepID=A0ABN0VNM7_9GAMM|nr:tetratricopeptide repeat protein [Psychrobacter aestuarii]